jgi:3-hydroxyisobutyrate dehydrogenase
MSAINESEEGAVILGLGIMGQAIADNLDEDGLLSATWNRTPKINAPGFHDSIEEAVSKSNILLILVSDGDAVSAVIDMISPALTEEHIIVQCATVLPEENIKFKNRIEVCGASFIEVLIGGSKVAAVERKIPLYLGGQKALVDYIDPLLSKISGKRIHVGDVGTASVAKLAMNLNLAMQVEALCESYAFATSNGLTDDQYFDVLRNNTGWNYLAEYKEPKLRNKDFEPQFSVKNMLKDVRLALAADKTDKGMSLLKKTESLYNACEESNLGDEDMIALYKMINYN